MEHIRIAALRPSLDALDSKQIKAVVTLIWPYSSSQRQFALLLAEPDFRLRRNKGQVRTRFSSTSARALAATGVGIGDEVVLSLHGAQFVQDGAVSTPGKSIDWELAYTQTVAISVRRNGAEIANLELVDAAPTPAPRSPTKQPAVAPSPIPQWSSPAFLKRVRLSDGPLFEQPAYDPFADESNEGHDKKRRRRSYRDWTAWTYTARTPSPEKEAVGSEDELDEAMSSPSRPPQLPKTPVSPTRTEAGSHAAEALEDSEYVEETTIADGAEGDTTVDDGELQKVHVPWSTSPKRRDDEKVHDADREDLDMGPGEAPPLDSQYDFGGDTELNTEDEEEEDAVPDMEGVELSATELATELEEEHEQTDGEADVVASQDIAEAIEMTHDDAASATQEDSVLQVIESDQPEGVSTDVEDTTIDETIPVVIEPPTAVHDPPATAMPPPSLPVLRTDFAASTVTGMLTPIGEEPSSPDLRAVDSATLPLPSPFPGEQTTSYFDHVSIDYQRAPLDGPVATEQEPESEADYIMENSFFSSTSSSRAGGLHQDHETAFTPVRFTFGMDGTGWSRPAEPLDLSSPSPEDKHTNAVDITEEPAASQVAEAAEPEVLVESIVTEQPKNVEEATRSSLANTLEENAADGLKAMSEVAKPEAEGSQPQVQPAAEEVPGSVPIPKSSNIVVLSSDVDSDESEEEDEEAVMAEPDEEETSEEETESESEDEVESEADEEHKTESEVGNLDSSQASPVGNKSREALDATDRIEPEAEHEQAQPQGDDAPGGTQPSAAVSEVVDSGSPSVDKSSDDEDDQEAIEPETAQIDDKAIEVGLVEDAASMPDNLGDFVAMDVVQEPITVASSSPVQYVHEPASITIPDTYEESPNLSFGNREPQLRLDESLPFIEDHDALDIQAESDHPIDGNGPPTSEVDHDHSGVKMESVEGSSLYMIGQPDTQDVPQESVNDPETDLLISIPENAHKLEELHSKSVPATVPARNTRSKTKSATSPTEEDAYVSRLSTSMRSTRPKTSNASTNRATQSPPGTRIRNTSTVSPTRDATQTSSYGLLSQSKHLSPERSATASQVVAPVRRSPRKLVRRDTDFDIVPSQVENRDLFGSMFEPSQELGFGYSQLSQGRYSDVGFVKDSEEDTSHYEGSISTVQHSDDDGAQAKLSDPVGSISEESTTPRLKPPPADVSQTQHQTRSRSHSFEDRDTFMSSSQPQQSPRRSPRVTRSTFSPSQSARITRTTKRSAQVSSSAPEEVVNKIQAEQLAPKATDQSVSYPVLQMEGESDLRSSPPAPASVDVASRRLSSAAQLPASAQQPTTQESNLLTPDDTQQTAMDPPLSFQARQPDQSLITPELTQQTSASATLRSFDIPLPGIQTQPAPPLPVLRTSPRRKPATTEPQSSSSVRTSSPIQQSSDAISLDDEDATLVQKKQKTLPSIGLSTPLAYYTPLRDLIYFLNRSSQFHSSSNPDVLALCTSASTSPEKAKKGPRHWNTTLHITDLSVWPEVRTVNVFRAYQNALPIAEVGDVVLLRAFAVESRKREPVLRSADESSWCVWRFGKPVWGAKKGKWGELRAREEVKGPVVERGEGEWTEVEKLRGWWLNKVKEELEKQREERERGKRELRSSSSSKGVEVQVEEVDDDQ